MDVTVLKIKVNRVVKNIVSYLMIGVTLDGISFKLDKPNSF